jgi:hypothetical protein
MNKHILIKPNLIPKRLVLVFFIGYSLVMLNSCGNSQLSNTANILDSSKAKSINQDSALNTVFKFGEPYFNIHSIDSMIALKGQPQSMNKTAWGQGGVNLDSILIVNYPLLSFHFLESPDSYLDLERIYFLDDKVVLGGNIKIGKTTSHDILQMLGTPDYNEHNRSITKSVDANVYEKKSIAADTVNLSYSINIDEYAIGFEMIHDTLRMVWWVKNMN